MQTPSVTTEHESLFQRESVDGVEFVTLAGKLIEFADFTRLQKELTQILQDAEAGETMLIDFENVTHFASSGLVVLDRLDGVARDHGKSIVLARLKGQPRDVFHITRYAVFEIRPDLAMEPRFRPAMSA